MTTNVRYAPEEILSEEMLSVLNRISSLTYACTACGRALTVHTMASGTGTRRCAIPGLRPRCRSCR